VKWKDSSMNFLTKITIERKRGGHGRRGAWEEGAWEEGAWEEGSWEEGAGEERGEFNMICFFASKIMSSIYLILHWLKKYTI
jgi:hypothetical protein